jgi:hypothetical protein
MRPKEDDMGISIVTKTVIMGAAALALGLGLAACGPQGKTPGAESGGGLIDGLFPKRTASYKATYEMKGGPAELAGAGPLVMTIYSNADKQRTETAIMGFKQVMILDPSAQVSYSYREGKGLPKIATKIDAKDFDQYDYKVDETGDVKPKKVGTDTVAGLSCSIWEAKRAGADPTEPAGQVCVTDDGIMLRVGTKEAPAMLATEVVKGPQHSALFALPAGYTVVDMGDCMQVMQDYAKAMQSGGKPDQAKFAECQKKMMAGFAP